MYFCVISGYGSIFRPGGGCRCNRGARWCRRNPRFVGCGWYVDMNLVSCYSRGTWQVVCVNWLSSANWIYFTQEFSVSQSNSAATIDDDFVLSIRELFGDDSGAVPLTGFVTCLVLYGDDVIHFLLP